MKRISEIICESIRACYEMNKNEHAKMDEFMHDNPDFNKITEWDFLTRKNNEVRHDTWNELNETLIKIIEEKKYDWKNIEEKDWNDLTKWSDLNGSKNGSI